MKLTKVFIFLSFFINAQSQNFEIYISDGGNFNNPPWQILKFDSNGQNPEMFTNENVSGPQDILFIEDQNIVLISNINTGIITKHDSNTGSYVDNFATGINGPTRMKIGADSLLYVLQWGGNGKVKRYELDGTFVDDFTNIGVPNSIGLDWDGDNNLYVSSYNQSYVRKFDPNGYDLGLFIDSNLNGPTNIWFNDNAELFVANWNGTTVKRFDSTGTYLNDFIQGLSKPEGVGFLPDGRILIGNGGTSAIKIYDINGNFIEDFISSGAGNLILPNAIVIREINTTPTFNIDFEAISVNPTIGKDFLISLTTSTIEEVPIIIFNSVGQFVEQLNVKQNTRWDTSNLPNGMYYIYFRNEKKYFIKKVIVQQF
jgi:type IX secretion system substrate protein